MKTDDNKSKYIIGNLVIPVTDEIKAKLKGDYSMEKLKKVFPAVFDRNHIQFLVGSVLCVDREGFDHWADTAHPDFAMKIDWIDARLRDMEIASRILCDATRPKPSLFQRIFRRRG